jgi:hypothetical protein
MGEATEFYYACALAVSEDVVGTATSPGLLAGPFQKGLIPSASPCDRISSIFIPLFSITLSKKS